MSEMAECCPFWPQVSHFLLICVLLLLTAVSVSDTTPCSAPPTPVNMTTPVYNGTTPNSIAVYTCLPGTIHPVSNDVTLTCNEQGVWEGPAVTCHAIDCGQAPAIGRAFQQFTGSTGYLDQVTYQCYSGHGYLGVSGQVTTFTLTCSTLQGTAQWNAPSVYNGSETFCNPDTNYVGCFAGDQDDVLTRSYGIIGCRRECLARSKTYAALRGGQCACADTTLVAVNDSDCSMDCEKSQDKLCGGAPDLWSVFATFHGCYSNISTGALFRSFNELTCTESCRGRDSEYSAFFLHGELCACLNVTDPTAVPENSDLCNKAEMSATASVRFLAMEAPTNAKTCGDLFSKGVHLHGDYYLKDATNTTPCHFYDGSADCETNWLSYNGHCYHFSSDISNFNNFTFDQAWNYCMQHDSLLVSINTLEEADFITVAQKGYSKVSEWYLGMYDHFQAFAHQWLDGSIQTFTQFNGKEPNDLDNPCVFAWFDDGQQQWYDSDCTGRRSFICERSNGVHGCVAMPNTGVNPIYSMVDENLMTLTLCFETCRAKDVNYTAVTGNTCQCFASLPAHTRVPWSECEAGCAGNAYQLCGDSAVLTHNGVDTVRAFLIEDVGQPSADSCTTMELQGIPATGIAIIGGQPVNCTDPSGVVCPYGWATVTGRCYKYFTRTSPDPAAVCRKMGGYLVVLDDPQEESDVFGDEAAPQVDSEWLVGLFSLNHGVYRTSNGRALKGLAVPDSQDTKNCVGYNVDSEEKRLVNRYCHVLPFVCEKGPDYVGCGTVLDTDQPVLSSYSEMSVGQCVELCRGQGHKYALLGYGPFRCYCQNQAPPKASEEFCDQFCFEYGQACGGSTYNVTSVYDVEQFPVFANSCMDLFEDDVLHPGTYLINGEPTYCYMKDNSSCSMPQSTWEGVGVEGACFKWYNLEIKGENAVATCKALDPPHMPTSVRSEAERELLVSVYKRTKSVPTQRKVHIGGMDQFQLGSFTWADGWLLTLNSTHWVSTYPRLNYGMAGKGAPGGEYLILSPNGWLSNSGQITEERSVICREVTDDLGCFINPTNLTAAVTDYASMGLQLCRQLCLGQNAAVALLDTASCFCLLDTDAVHAAGGSEAGCDVPCPGNSLQSCASPGFLRAYRVYPGDVAENCDTLHANFVVLNNTYMLKNNITGDITPNTCGFADATQCPAGFLGNKGKCYRFYPWTYLTTELAAQQCRSVGGYLATPRDLEELNFLVTAVTNMPSLATFNEWRLGVVDSIQGQLRPSSDGSLLVSSLWNLTTVPDNTTCTTLKVTEVDVDREQCLSTLPFVCEIGPVFKGCRSFSSGKDTTASFDLSLTSISVQQCVSLCYGQNARLAILTSSCFCADSHLDNSTLVSCPAHCDHNVAQSCGDDVTAVYAVYDIDAYSVAEKAARSCSLYRQALVTAKGEYYLYLSDNSQLRVTCGTYGSGHHDILTREERTAQYTASSAFNTVATDARLGIESAVWTSWQSWSNDTSPWLQVILSDYYLIKAIAITGSGDIGGGYVTELRMSHGFTENSLTVYSSSLYGPSQRTGLALRYLSDPVVAKVVRLEPVTWSLSSSLAFTLLGELYSSFNHTELYMGCFTDPSNSLFVSWVAASSSQQCRDYCQNQSYPLFGLIQRAGTKSCGCGNTLGEYGELDVTSCNATCVNLRCGSDVSMSVAVYRTYDKQCAPPPLVTNSEVKVTSLVVASDEVYSVGSTVTYTCQTGYEFPDLTTSLNITCQQNNTWSQIPFTSCHIVQCEDPPAVSNGYVTYSNVSYGSVATYTCEGRYRTSAGLESVTTYCTHTKTWDPTPPVCKSRHQPVCKFSQGQQLSSSAVTSLYARSLMDCARRCMVHTGQCQIYSFGSNTTAGADNCRLLDDSSTPDFEAAPDWNIYKLSNDC